MNARTLLVALVVAALPSLAEARRVDARFLLDMDPGITVPIADGAWRGYAGPSFKFSLRVGGELWVGRGFGIAGEFDLDPSPLMTTDGVQGRVRGLVGMRLLFGFGIGAFYIRHAIGVDYIGHLHRNGVIEGEAALAVEPGVGVQFRVVRHLVVGFDVAFPIGFFDPFMAADVQFLGFLGVRL